MGIYQDALQSTFGSCCSIFSFPSNIFCRTLFLLLSFFSGPIVLSVLFIGFSEGPGGSMSQVVGLPNSSYKPITNTAWVRARLCKLQKGCFRLAATSDKVYLLLAHARWFSPVSSTAKTGHHDIAEILLKVALNTKNPSIGFSLLLWYLQMFLTPIKIQQTYFNFHVGSEYNE